MLKWKRGLYPDGWLARSAALGIGGVNRLDVEFYLPADPASLGKQLIVSTTDTAADTLVDRELARAFILRGAVTAVTIPVGGATGDLHLLFGEAEQATGDARSLGAVCVRLRADDGPWVHAVVETKAAPAPPASPLPPPRPSPRPLAKGPVDGFRDVMPSFDADFYAQRYGATGSAEELFGDFLVHGWKEERDPSADFSTAFYLANDPQLRRAGLNPLVHWVRHGRAERRATRPTSIPAPAPPAVTLGPQDLALLAPFFDESYYLAQLAEPLPATTAPLDHYMTTGYRASLNPSRLFNTAFYARCNPELAAAGVHPLLHFARHGHREKRPGVPYADLRRQRYRPLVSVIVPNYNHARFLPERLRSIAGQSYRNIEIILLDDCSTDHSLDLLRVFAATSPLPARVVANEANSGSVFAQWQKGFALAAGELVWICESDDTCAPDFLERMVAQFADRGTMIAFGRIQFCDQDDTPVEGLDAYRQSAEAGIWSTPITRPAREWFANAFGRNNVIANVGGCVIRNQTLAPEVWAQARSFRICGDWYLYLALARGGRIAYDPGAVAYFRQHGLNTSAHNFDKLYYYRELRTIGAALDQAWGRTAETREGFERSVRYQWNHYAMSEEHGRFEDFFAADVDPDPTIARTHIVMGSLGFIPGGGEAFPVHLANALAQAGVRVSMLCINLVDLNESLIAALDPRVAVYDAAEAKTERPATFLRRTGATLVHSHVIAIDDLFFRGADPLGDFPYVVTLHGSHDGEELEVDQLLFRMLKAGCKWVYTADKNLRIFGRAPLDPRALAKVANAMPIDPRPFPQSRADLGIDDDTILFTFVARGIERKGWRAVIAALRHVRRERPLARVHVAMVGDGPKADEAQAAAPAGLPVTFLGFQSCINGLYRISDCAVVPSRFSGESYPLCIIQALQEGVPVVATDIGEVRTMIAGPDGCAGVLVPNLRDSEQFFTAFGEAMIAMLDDAERTQASALAKEFGSRYRMDTLVERYLEVYDDALERVDILR